jgi:hypothetical protein
LARRFNKTFHQSTHATDGTTTERNEMIIECKECTGKVSDKAESCPHCGAPVIKETVVPTKCNSCGLQIPVGLTECPNCALPVGAEDPEDNDLYILQKKSNVLSFFLTFFLGPIGVLYSSIGGGVILILATLGLTLASGPVGVFFAIIMWVLSMIIGQTTTDKHNCRWLREPALIWRIAGIE